MSLTKNPTKRQAEKVLAAVRRQYKPWITSSIGPKLVEDWGYYGAPAKWSIVWEEGPFEWAIMFPYGGRDQEFGFKLADVSDALPEGFYAEPYNGWSVGIYAI